MIQGFQEIKPVTMDDLALMINNGFKEADRKLNEFRSEVNSKFLIIDQRFIAIDERFDRLETRFDRLENHFGSLEKTVRDDHGHRLRKLETKLQIA